MNRVLTLVLIIFCTSNLFGEGVSIFINSINKNKIEPGTNITYPVKISKSLSSYAQIYLEADLPEGWSCILESDAITLPPGATVIKLMNVKIPSGANAGSYAIGIKAFNNKKKTLITEAKTTIEVIEVVGLDVDLVDVPEYTKSGELVNAKLYLKSTSNKEVSVRLQPRKCNIIEEHSFLLEPGETRLVDISIIPMAEANKVNNYGFGINALVGGNDSTEFSANEYIHVIPSEFKKIDNRFKYPVYFKALYLSRKFESGFKHAFQGEVYGNGFLGPNSQNLLEFRLRGPNTYNLSSLGSVDEYFAKFKSKHFDVLIGDNNYRVTPLIEPGRYARGVAVAGRIGGFEVTAFYNQPRFFPDVKQNISASATYSFKEKYKVGVHYLTKDYVGVEQNAHVASVTGEFEPIKFTKLFVEYSRSKLADKYGNGVYAYLTSKFWRVNISGYVIYSDEDYTGYYNNTISYIGNFNIGLFKGFSFYGSFQRDERNAARDTLYASAPFTINYRAGFNWSMSRFSTLRGYGGYREREDRMPTKKFHYDEFYGKLEYNQIIKKFIVNLAGELSRTTNYLLTTNNTGPGYGGYLDIGYRPRNNINVTAFVSYRYDNRYSINPTSRLFYGCSLDAWISKSTHLYFRFQNGYSIEEYYRDRDFFTLMFNQRVGRHSEIILRTQYGMLQRDLETSDLSVEVSYTYHLGVPLGNEKIEYGKVIGNIKNLGVRTIEGIILHLNSHTAITDSKGNFTFEDVIPGSYFLILDRTTIDFQDIPDRKVPIAIQVIEHEDIYVELGLTRSGVIHGTIEMSDNLPLPADVNKIIVELRNGKEVVKSVTDETGKFRFSGVRPGTWEIILHDGGLKNKYYFKETSFEFDIEPDETLTLPLKLYKKERVIKLKENTMRVIQMQ